MGLLILAILASFSIALLIKDNETRGARTEMVLASNYLSASALGWAFVLLDRMRVGGSLEIGQTTLLLGLGGGLLWPSTFYLMMWGIRRYGVSLAGSISRLSLSIPLLFAVIFLGERLTPAIALGIAGAFLALALLAPIRLRSNLERKLDRQALWYFPVLVLAFGLVDLWVNLFNAIAPGEERFFFIVLIFTGAAIFSALAVAIQRRRLDRQAILRGLLLGIPNFFSTYFLMESLRTPFFAGLSAVVYALYSALGVILTFLAGALIWREPLTRRNRVGVFVAVIAVVLLNVG